MRNLKFSFALIIALIAVGTTLASKAGDYGSRAITDCFQNLTITDGTTDQVLFSGLAIGTANSRIASHPYVRAVSNAIDPDECEGSTLFCCATIVVTDAEDAPEVELEGEDPAKYEVLAVVTKN